MKWINRVYSFPALGSRENRNSRHLVMEKSDQFQAAKMAIFDNFQGS